MTADKSAGNRGRFITLEGSEGVGKTSNLKVIEAHLLDQGIDLVVTREPGGTALGERVRKVLLEVAADAEEPPMAAMAELLLMFAARAQHVTHVIEPALAAGKWVLSDRFTDASFAYQGGGRGVDMTSIDTLQTLVQGELRPDKTLYLDLDPAVAFERIAGRAHDRIEREQLDFFHRVRDCYLERAASEPQRFSVIDAGSSLAAVAEDVRAALNAFLAAEAERPL
jgi:dTMP kinase